MDCAVPNYAAIVLAGGRSSRLGGRPKAALRFEGQTLLERTLAAVADARHTVISGDASLVAGAAPRFFGGDADVDRSRVSVTRENPPFAGPAAAVAAGVDALVAAGVTAATLVAVLACDMPHVDAAVQALLAAASGTPSAVTAPSAGTGVMAVDDDGRAQFLTAVYRLDALVDAVALARQAGPLDDLSVKRLFAPLQVRPVSVPPGSTHDVDTFDDLAAFGIDLASDPPAARTSPAATPAVSGIDLAGDPLSTPFEPTGTRS